MIAPLSTTGLRAVVLLVEDDVLVRTIAAEILSDAEFRVVEADNSAAALQKLADGLTPDVLVTDVRMPGSIDGFELAHIVASRWPRTGILVCSGHAAPRPGEMPGGAVFLAKPYLPARLAGEVAALAAAKLVDV